MCINESSFFLFFLNFYLYINESFPFAGVCTDDEDDDDIHFCKKCRQVFKKIEAYLEHKVKHDKFKMAYSRAPGDRRMVFPTLKKESLEKPVAEEGQGEDVGTQADTPIRPRKRNVQLFIDFIFVFHFIDAMQKIFSHLTGELLVLKNF